MKKFILPILFVPFFVLAHDFEVNGIYYKYTGDNTVAVTFQGDHYYSSNNDYSGDIIIPTSVKHLYLRYKVASIEEHAFHSCINLNSVTIPKSVNSIGSSAFYGCSNLKSLIIEDCANELSLSSTSDNYPFEKCKIEELYIGRNLSSWKSLCNSNQLRSVEIGNLVTYIGPQAFYGCSGLNSVNIPCSVATIGASAFARCLGIKEVSIPEGVISIGDSAFALCQNLPTINIPSTISTIGKLAFNRCKVLSEIYCMSREPENIEMGDEVFYDVSRNCTLFVPMGNKAKYENISQWKDFKKIVEKGFLDYGDANGDGVVDARDIAYNVDYILGISHDEFDTNVADVNYDGNIDATDISLIIKIILNR